ncbi:16S rRNA (guanine(966)-N(2))-methyltransferase RsmD [Janthinobacterium sp. 17J80-10]|uniref:16S rRNA (guanine(966)-N(2))-methyltransferase RsmD n=1 Tax=Janthinobacterium sp. 17J80-10 TaxID=2497863 RepID=UPI001005A092|nr:16S rRNA (guanine(966)-N(2))-methyltransferase RsmD [Janthinobacterium sp. 17J80-10]QAU33376.1 16S rRNA (guanine(966)-N(2))-methyltransferase RsmD [Janthinobacterium sp. 17J80-10]
MNKPQAKKAVPHQVRIIGGLWKRTPLPVADAAGLRPTPDRVRETVFNWINHLFDGAWEGRACLDLFAGSGALGFEAASRGAARVLMVENHSPALRQLEAVKGKLQASQVTVMRGDALARVRELAAGLALAQAVAGHAGRREGAFDIIFLDPPYHQDWLAKILPHCAALLQPGGLVYAEAEVPLVGLDAPWLAEWEIVRADKAGMVFYHLLQNGNMTGIQA